MQIIILILTLFFVSCSSNNSLISKDESFYISSFFNNDSELVLDISSSSYPKDLASYNPVFHFSPQEQGYTMACWCFATISMLESELVRLGKKSQELSRMYIVYWEYLEKARLYFLSKGGSPFVRGSLAESALARLKQYGIVRASDYTGLIKDNSRYNFDALYYDLMLYLDWAITRSDIDEDKVITDVCSILNSHMGKPPRTIMVKGQSLTPLEYLNEELALPLNDYVSFVSFKNAPFWTQTVFDVPDNWYGYSNYLNVPLEDYYQALVKAISQEYSVTIGSDVTEPGFSSGGQIALIADFDIPKDLINQDARELRFFNKSSTDDHALHLIGYTNFDGDDWFLLKDSSYYQQKTEPKGYRFFRGDYIKLKMLTFTVHREGVSWLLEKYNKNSSITP